MNCTSNNEKRIKLKKINPPATTLPTTHPTEFCGMFLLLGLFLFDMLKKLLLLLIVVILAPFTLSYDLSDFPTPFIQNQKFNTVIVVGENASPVDIQISLAELIFQLSQKNNVSRRRIELLFPGIPKLDTEIKNISVNIISIGGPCANKITAQIMVQSNSWPECSAGFKNGSWRIIIFNKWNKTQVVVAGYSEFDTQRAVNFLINYEKNNLTGIELEGTQSGTGDVTVTQIYPYVGPDLFTALNKSTKVTILVDLRDNSGVIIPHKGIINLPEDKRKERDEAFKQLREHFDKITDEVLSTLPQEEFNLTHRFTSGGFGGVITKRGIQILSNNPHVKNIFMDRPLKLY